MKTLFILVWMSCGSTGGHWGHIESRDYHDASIKIVATKSQVEERLIKERPDKVYKYNNDLFSKGYGELEEMEIVPNYSIQKPAPPDYSLLSTSSTVITSSANIFNPYYSEIEITTEEHQKKKEEMK